METKEAPNPDWLVCDDCGRQGPDVRETICPYCEEIYGEIVECRLCGDCYRDRRDDI